MRNKVTFWDERNRVVGVGMSKRRERAPTQDSLVLRAILVDLAVRAVWSSGESIDKWEFIDYEIGGDKDNYCLCC